MDVCFTTGSAVCFTELDLLSNSDLLPTSILVWEAGSIFVVTNSHPTGRQQKGSSSSSKKITRNKSFYLLWFVVSHPGLWEKPSVIPNGVALWRLAPDMRPGAADNGLTPWTKGIRARNPRSCLLWAQWASSSQHIPCSISSWEGKPFIFPCVNKSKLSYQEEWTVCLEPVLWNLWQSDNPCSNSSSRSILHGLSAYVSGYKAVFCLITVQSHFRWVYAFDLETHGTKLVFHLWKDVFKRCYACC